MSDHINLIISMIITLVVISFIVAFVPGLNIFWFVWFGVVLPAGVVIYPFIHNSTIRDIRAERQRAAEDEEIRQHRLRVARQG